MKTYLKYGGIMAGVVFVIVLALFALGFHSEVSKLSAARWIQGGLGLVVSIVCIVLATKERRAATPAEEPFGYGQALGTGVMTTLIAALIGIATTWLYVSVINPAMTDIAMQAQVAQWEAAGMSASRIEQAEAMMRKMMHPAIQACFGFVFGMIFGTIISLVTAAFLKRSESELPPVQG
jgi:hypothetical protein